LTVTYSSTTQTCIVVFTLQQWLREKQKCYVTRTSPTLFYPVRLYK